MKRIYSDIRNEYDRVRKRADRYKINTKEKKALVGRQLRLGRAIEKIRKIENREFKKLDAALKALK